MTSINISLRREAYDFLNSFRNGEKSFSDVVLELSEKKRKGNKEEVLKFWGVLRDKKDWGATENRMKNFRKSFEEEISQRTKR